MRTRGKMRKKPAPKARTTRPVGQVVFSDRDITIASSISGSEAAFIVLVVAGILTTDAFLAATYCIDTSFDIAGSGVIAVAARLAHLVVAASSVVVPTFDHTGANLCLSGWQPYPNSAKIEVFFGAYHKPHTLLGADSPDIEVTSGAYVRGTDRGAIEFPECIGAQPPSAKWQAREIFGA
ncbi:hypothetical protein K488DRAFT_75374, partial [Vararia minispora EC-137]